MAVSPARGVHVKRVRSSRWLPVVAALGCLALAPASVAQDAGPELVPWAPRWRKGDWWVVKTYQRDLQAHVTSPAAAEGAMPRVPADPRAEPLPGLPPLRDGVPEGWKVANTFRFEVLRRELVRYPGDAPSDPPEPFVVVSLRTLEGDERAAELWYTEADLTLAKVVMAPNTERARTHELSGTLLVDPSVSAAIGFPLDWPDFVAAKQPTAEVVVEGRGTFEQRVRAVQGETQVRLATMNADGEARGRVLMSFRPGAPFWVRLVGPVYLAELTEQGRGR